MHAKLNPMVHSWVNDVATQGSPTYNGYHTCIGCELTDLCNRLFNKKCENGDKCNISPEFDTISTIDHAESDYKINKNVEDSDAAASKAIDDIVKSVKSMKEIDDRSFMRIPELFKKIKFIFKNKKKIDCLN